MSRRHEYSVSLRWTGNTGSGTSDYRSYTRDYEILAAAKPAILGSADPLYRGDATRWNPEELLLAALAACHQLWYLHLCADAGIVVLEYEDAPEGVMEERADGSGRFTEVTLKPRIRLAARSDVEAARALHEPAHEKCAMANSVNFAVRVEPETLT